MKQRMNSCPMPQDRGMHSGNDQRLTRRKMMAGALVGGLGCADLVAAQPCSIENAKRQREFRFAHMTDIHLSVACNAPKGLKTALDHIHSRDDRPDLIITGGDIVSEALAAGKEQAAEQYALVKAVFSEHCSLPVRHCLGNHDIWGWNKDSKTSGNEPLWGKKWPVREYEMPGRYYAFNQGCWRIIILDSMMKSSGVYTARLDEEQFEWLIAELETSVDKYVCVISHIPILTVTAFFDGNNEQFGEWRIPHQWMFLDARRIVALFSKHPNVKLCISGHIHMLDRVEFQNVTYICDGAVCGCWWKGPYQKCPEGYGLFDLYNDGTFTHEYMNYGWKAEA